MALTKAHNRMINGASASVKDFGAVGDGVADDSAAIQAANDSSAGSVVFPAGTYRIASPISATKNWSSDGGAQIALAASTAFGQYAILISGAGAVISGLAIDGNADGSATAERLVSITGDDVVFRGNTITDVYQDGVWFSGDGCIIDGNHVSYTADNGAAGSEGIAGVNSNNATIINNVVTDCIDDGISLHVCNDGLIANNNITNKFAKGACINLVGKCFNVTADGNVCRAIGAGTAGAAVIRANIEESALLANRGNGNSMNIINNTIYVDAADARDYGIRVLGNGSNSRISGNNIYGNGIEITGIEVAEYTFDGVTYTPENITISENSFYGDKATYTVTGVKAVSGVTGLSVANNLLANLDVALWVGENNSVFTNKFVGNNSIVKVGQMSGTVFANRSFAEFQKSAIGAGTINLPVNGLASLVDLVFDEDVYIAGISCQVNTLPATNNLNILAQHDSGGGYASITGLSLQFNSGTATYLEDFIFASQPLKVAAGEKVRIQTTQSGALGATPDVYCKLFFVRLT